jgi:hypothetical protein
MPAKARPKDAPALPSFKDETFYRVQLFRPAELEGRTLKVQAHHVMTGESAKEIVDRIWTAEEMKQEGGHWV